MKTTFLKQTPHILIYSRLLIAVYFILVAIFKGLQDPITVSICIIFAVLSDVFDGIIARRMKVDSVHLRQLDSKVDTLFWLALLYVLLVMENSFIRSHAKEFFILLALEITLQIFGYIKFNSAMALHTYAAKAWAVLLTLSVLQILSGKNAEIIFYTMFFWGLIAQLEVALIIFKMKTFKVDVSSVFKLKN
ncbi:MAG: CDP-alcohol phosphatidyltransferase family protein [Bacteroidetes bacterium]|nr:CDP-alcohol phosphatidyltransferase family protein [Bacteroidota bacterium]